jgi:hypothetical protein
LGKLRLLEKPVLSISARSALFLEKASAFIVSLELHERGTGWGRGRAVSTAYELTPPDKSLVRETVTLILSPDMLKLKLKTRVFEHDPEKRKLKSPRQKKSQYQNQR